MRRWFLVFLTLMVFAQLSFGAARVCCAEEWSSTPAHAKLLDGDHAEASLQDIGDDTAHACELGHCHCHHATVACGVDDHLQVGAALAAPPGDALAARDSSHIPPGLDRPNWHRA